MKPGVILVDDHPAVLRQTAQLLSDRFEILASIEDPAHVDAAVRNFQPELIVLDISFPGACGIHIAARLMQNNFRGEIVFLTAHADPDYAHEAFAAGASGYVIKSRLASDLLPALHAALSGDRFVSPCPEFKDLDLSLFKSEI